MKKIVKKKSSLEKIATKNSIKIMKSLLEGVVENGTADNIKHSNYKIAGKTGTAKKVVNEAKEHDLNIFDATCPLVTKVHLEAIKLHSNGYHILLVGHDGHPEIEGTRGQVPKESITLIQNLEEAKNFITKDSIKFFRQIN